MNQAAKSLKDVVEEVISSFPPADSRGRSIATQLRNYSEILAVQSRPADEHRDESPVRVLDMTLPVPQLRPPRKALPQVRPVDTSGRLPLLPVNRQAARETAGFTIQEVAVAADTTVATAKIYEQNRAAIRRNDKRKALDDVYRLFLEVAP